MVQWLRVQRPRFDSQCLQLLLIRAGSDLVIIAVMFDLINMTLYLIFNIG